MRQVTPLKYESPNKNKSFFLFQGLLFFQISHDVWHFAVRGNRLTINWYYMGLILSHFSHIPTSLALVMNFVVTITKSLEARFFYFHSLTRKSMAMIILDLPCPCPFSKPGGNWNSDIQSILQHRENFVNFVSNFTSDLLCTPSRWKKTYARTEYGVHTFAKLLVGGHVVCVVRWGTFSRKMLVLESGTMREDLFFYAFVLADQV